MTALAISKAHVSLGGQTVLHEVSAAFAAGQVTVIVGPNGAGKSTLLSCLAGLRQPDQGCVMLGETAMQHIPVRERAQCIGFLPQIPEVAWAVDVRTLVGLGRTPFIGARGLSQEDVAIVDRALAATEMMPLAHRVVTTLSGGERARALIARALAGEPRWLLADEPLTGLDPGHQIDAVSLFRALATEKGCGVILTLHDLHMALRVADHVVVLAEGCILAQGVPAQALSPDVLAKTYGVNVRMIEGQSGPMIEILGRRT